MLTTLLEVAPEITTLTDACTLNNIMNVVQIAILVALLRWVRSDDHSSGPSRSTERE